MPDLQNFKVTPLAQDWEISGEVHESRFGGRKLKERKGASAFWFLRDFRTLPPALQEEIVQFAAVRILTHDVTE